jgi:hypothetical protein
MNTLEWLENWYNSNCDGDWEHEYGVEITTIDNPGWRITIDLAETKYESINIEYQLVEQNENNWYGYSVLNSKFIGVGSPEKLTQLIELFKNIINTHSNKN